MYLLSNFQCGLYLIVCCASLIAILAQTSAYVFLKNKNKNKNKNLPM